PRIIIPYVVALLQSQNSGPALLDQLVSWNEKFPSSLFDLTRAITEAELGAPKKAHAIYEAILKKEPDQREAMVNDAILLYRDLAQPSRGAELLRKVLRHHAESLSMPVRAMITAHLGAALVKVKDWKGAGDAFDDSVRVDPGNLALLDFVTR